jgi:hypothetical protein
MRKESMRAWRRREETQILMRTLTFFRSLLSIQDGLYEVEKPFHATAPLTALLNLSFMASFSNCVFHWRVVETCCI